MKNLWIAKAYGVLKNGRLGWYNLRTFTDFEEADNWLCEFINSNGYYYGDFKISRA